MCFKLHFHAQAHTFFVAAWELDDGGIIFFDFYSFASWLKVQNPAQREGF